MIHERYKIRYDIKFYIVNSAARVAAHPNNECFYSLKDVWLRIKTLDKKVIIVEFLDGVYNLNDKAGDTWNTNWNRNTIYFVSESNNTWINIMADYGFQYGSLMEKKAYFIQLKINDQMSKPNIGFYYGENFGWYAYNCIFKNSKVLTSQAPRDGTSGSVCNCSFLGSSSTIIGYTSWTKVEMLLKHSAGDIAQDSRNQGIKTCKLGVFNDETELEGLEYPFGTKYGKYATDIGWHFEVEFVNENSTQWGYIVNDEWQLSNTQKKLTFFSIEQLEEFVVFNQEELKELKINVPIWQPTAIEQENTLNLITVERNDYSAAQINAIEIAEKPNTFSVKYRTPSKTTPLTITSQQTSATRYAIQVDTRVWTYTNKWAQIKPTEVAEKGFSIFNFNAEQLKQIIPDELYKHSVLILKSDDGGDIVSISFNPNQPPQISNVKFFPGNTKSYVSADISDPEGEQISWSLFTKVKQKVLNLNGDFLQERQGAGTADIDETKPTIKYLLLLPSSETQVAAEHTIWTKTDSYRRDWDFEFNFSTKTFTIIEKSTQKKQVVENFSYTPMFHIMWYMPPQDYPQLWINGKYITTFSFDEYKTPTTFFRWTLNNFYTLQYAIYQDITPEDLYQNLLNMSYLKTPNMWKMWKKLEERNDVPALIMHRDNHPVIEKEIQNQIAYGKNNAVRQHIPNHLIFLKQKTNPTMTSVGGTWTSPLSTDPSFTNLITGWKGDRCFIKCDLGTPKIVNGFVFDQLYENGKPLITQYQVAYSDDGVVYTTTPVGTAEFYPIETAAHRYWGVYLLDEHTGIKNPMFVQMSATTSNLLLEATDKRGNKSSVPIGAFKSNLIPTLTIVALPRALSIDLNDKNLDKIKYQVRINNEIFVRWTELHQAPLHLSIPITDAEPFKLGENTVEVEVIDELGGYSSQKMNFTHKTNGLYFEDKDGKIYTTNANKIQQKLDFGAVLIGQKTDAKELYIVNHTDRALYNIKITSLAQAEFADNDGLVGATTEYTIPYLAQEQKARFFVRIQTQVSTLEGEHEIVILGEGEF